MAREPDLARTRLWHLLLDPVFREVLADHGLPTDFPSRHLRLDEACAERGLSVDVIVCALRVASDALEARLRATQGA